jgi:hypothetical protein
MKKAVKKTTKVVKASNYPMTKAEAKKAGFKKIRWKTLKVAKGAALAGGPCRVGVGSDGQRIVCFVDPATGQYTDCFITALPGEPTTGSGGPPRK